jgi:methionyl-tRNA formyltransferase
VYVLELLLERVAPECVLVVAPPQGKQPSWQASLEAAAKERGVPSFAPDDVNDEATVARIRDHRAGLLLSVYYTQIFRRDLLRAVDGPVLNFHPSLLPRHRGTAPIIWAIADGDEVTGLSVHHVDEGIDTGPILYRRPLPIHRLDSGYDLHRKLALLVRSTAADLLRRHFAGADLPPAQEQSGDTSYHTSRDPRLNHLSWHDPRERIRNVVRALAPPLPGAFTHIGGREVLLVEVEAAEPPRSAQSRPAGMVEYEAAGWPLVWAADGPVRVLQALSDGRALDGRELRALGIPQGALAS